MRVTPCLGDVFHGPAARYQTEWQTECTTRLLQRMARSMRCCLPSQARMNAIADCRGRNAAVSMSAFPPKPSRSGRFGVEPRRRSALVTVGRCLGTVANVCSPPEPPRSGRLGVEARRRSGSGKLGRCLEMGPNGCFPPSRAHGSLRPVAGRAECRGVKGVVAHQRSAPCRASVR